MKHVPRKQFQCNLQRTNCTPLPLGLLPPAAWEARVAPLTFGPGQFCTFKTWHEPLAIPNWPLMLASLPSSPASLNTWVVHVCVCVCVERPHFQFGAAVSGFDCSFSHPLCLPPTLPFSLLHSLAARIGWRPNNPKSSRLDYIAGTWCCSQFLLLLLLQLLLLKLWFFRKEMKNISTEFSLV